MSNPTTAYNPQNRNNYGRFYTSSGVSLKNAIDPFLQTSYNNRMGFAQRQMKGRALTDLPPINRPGSTYYSQKPVGSVTFVSPGDQRIAGRSGRNLNDTGINTRGRPSTGPAGRRSAIAPSATTWPSAIPQRPPMATQPVTSADAPNLSTRIDHVAAIRKLTFNNQSGGSVFAPRRRR